MLELDTCIGLSPENELIALTYVTDSKVGKNTTALKFVKSSFIKSIAITNRKQSSKVTTKNGPKQDPNTRFGSFEFTPSLVNTSELNAKLRKSEPSYRRKFLLDKALESRSHISKEGRAVFERLFKLLPEGAVKWSKDDIVIFDDHLKISKPYRSSDCKLCNGKEDSTDSQMVYVRQIVAGEWISFDSERKGG
ncbi:unnamed protein product [Kuraishia capsulata CBS 1993]|uniref:AD domain-containing protein n=1 Tax=Kuraishia capsulata CBS 1993 TaxID=1382522 RepID=W6MFU4_9ASCO|nr:uncharacterized protein KUCA_T00000238001 [Kuraishia capsulata CBS 1993]CDK24278.1 unnamed protein product [Kuraishia capsulata CBS 1993]